MYPNQIKGVTQFAATRVRPMMRKCKFIIVQDQT